MGRYKEGSRIQEVYSVFEKKGGMAAYEFGVKLVKVVTLKNWVHVWSKEKGEVSPIRHIKPPKDQEAHRTTKEAKAPKVPRSDKKAKETGPIEQREKVRAPSVKPPKKAKAEGGPIVMHTKELVTVSYAKKGENQAYLLDQGPQASLIRFKHTGTDQVISNEWLGLPVKKEKPKPIEKETREPKGDADETRKRYLLD